MEQILHYVWKYRLHATTSLYTMDGFPVEIIDPGVPNPDAGPDFFNAKIRIGGTLWAGSIEMHTSSSDWYTHNHNVDKAYDTVVLHVVEKVNREVFRTDGSRVPQLELPVPAKIRQNIEWLLFRDKNIACLAEIRSIDPFFLNSWLDQLVNERLERKTETIFQLLEKYQEDWNEVFYIVLARNLGFGVNSDAFESLARNLPFKYLLKHRENNCQLEAMLIGQAGLLEEEIEDEYYKILQKEYRFLKHKFGLETNTNYFFKNLRTRPENFPVVKLAQLAAILGQYDTLFSQILHTVDPEDIKKYFRIPPSSYWLTHYHFRASSPERVKLLGEDSIRVVLINTVVPVLFAYGAHTHQPVYCDRALLLLETLPPEKNHIVTLFSQAGLIPRNAGDSQGLIQLKREYCEKRKCLYCSIGFRLLKRS
ncbi:MAG: DUF2851 family protein [Tannerellaceae bacterium]|nr:DUF2851 family protein [Tannerellaceae bacterium]